MRYAAKEGRSANEIELTNLLHDREKWEILHKKQLEIEAAKEEKKQDALDQLTKTEYERRNKEKRMVQNLLDSVEDLDRDKMKILNKSLYELAEENNNETLAPSLDSYGNSGVYLRYKMNKWFENINVLELKKLKAQQEGEILLELLDVGKKMEREKERERKRRERMREKEREELRKKEELERMKKRLEELAELKAKKSGS